MADESIKIDIDVNAAGADKAAQSISALEKQIGSLQGAVAALKAPSARGGSVLDSLQLDSTKVKNLKETSSALKSVADALGSLNKAAGDASKADLSAGVDKAVSAYRQFIRETRTMNNLSKDHITKLKDTASAMREVASASNAMAEAESKAKKAQAALNQSQARKTEAQAEKLRAQASVKHEDNAIPLQRQKGRDERSLVKTKGDEAARLAEIQATSQLQQAELKLAGTTVTAEAKREAAAVAASAKITAAREAEAARTQRAMIKEQGSGERQMMRISASQANAQLRANEQAIEQVRYAARDTAVYYGAITAGLGTLVSSAAQAGIAQERAFADVKRTAQGTTADLTELRKAYTDLSTEKVVTPFADLAKIGTLGAQMNIPTKDLKDFTTAVAEFSTVTEMDVEAATTAFGRFGQMMGGLQESSKGAGDGYKILANQVADLGAKSVATEPEIANMMVSIAAQGKSAGFTQNQILALSSTLSSLAIPKEWARGSLQRIFNSINAAAAEGGDAMHTYAQAVGVTDAEFQKLWRDDPNKVFQGILQHLAGINDKVEKAQAIKDLGFKNVRDVELLARMSNSVGLYVSQLKEAEEASKNTSFIDDSMSIITDTLSAKLQQFQNALQNAGAAMNSSFMVPMKAIVTVATMAVNAFAKLPAPIQAFVGALTMVSVARVGMTAAKAALMSMSASYIQMQTRIMQATGQQKLSWGIVFQAVKQAQAGVASYDGALASNVATANAAAAANQRLAAADNMVAAAAGKAAVAKGAQNAAQMASAGASAAAAGAQVAAGAGQAVGALSRLSSVGSGLMAMFGGPWGLAITGAITAVTVAASYLGDSFTSASEKAENFSNAAGGSSAILNALAQDTKEVGNGTQSSFVELNATIEQNGEVLTANGQALGYYVDKSGQVVQATHEQAEAMGYSTLKIGEHTQALIMDAIQGSDAFKGMSKETKQALVDMGFSYAKYIKLATTSESQGGGQKAADAYVDGYIQQLEARKGEITSKINHSSTSPSQAQARNIVETKPINDQINALNELKGQTDGVGGAMRDALNNAILFGQGVEETGEQTEDAGFKIGSAKGEFKDMAEVIRSVLDEMFSSTDAAAALDSALQDVYNSMQEHGTSMDPNSADGQANIAAISNYFEKMGNAAAAGIEEMGLTGEEAYQYAQQSIQDAIDYLTAQGFDMSAFEQQRDTMAAIIAQPYESGPVDHSKTDETLGQMVGNAIDAVNQAQGALGKIQAIWNAISSYQGLIGGAKSKTGKGSFNLGQKSKIRMPTFANRNNGKSAFSANNFREKPQRSSSSGGGGGGGHTPRSGGGSGSRAKKEAKTAAEIFEDFLSRLKSALDKALTSWWRSTTAQDNYHKGLNSLRKDVENTTKKVSDLRKENEKLASDMRKNQQELHDAEFFHAVAVKYGDEERMRSTQTDIDEAKQKINEGQTKIADNDKEIATLQAGQFALKGYTEAAIANREALRSLQSQMIGLIEAYAAAGHSTQEIEAYTQSLKQQFIDQVTQLGFNQGEVTELAGAFDSLTGTIGQVPREVKEHVTDNGTVGTTQSAINSLHADPVTVPVQPSQSQINVKIHYTIDEASYNAARARVYPRTGGGGTVRDSHGRNLGTLYTGGLLSSDHYIPGFAGGGLLPGRPPANPKADNLMATDGHGMFRVRSGEYVISQPAVDFYGKGFMNALNTLQVPVSAGGVYQMGSDAVLATINPAQFNELVKAVSTSVLLDGQAIGRNIDNRNEGAGSRGVY